MSTLLYALLPIAALIGAGFLMRRLNLVEPGFWPSVERLTYYVLMPVLLVHSMAGKDVGSLPWREIALAVSGPLLLTAFVLVQWHRWRRTVDGATFTSIFQGGVRMNTYVGLAVAGAFFGTDGLVVGALVAGMMIVTINVLCVTVFAVTLNRDGLSARGLARQIVTNPLIVGCLVGGALSVTGTTLPQPVAVLTGLLSPLALPLALLAVGAALDFARLGSDVRWAALSSLAQFLVKPALAVVFCTLFGLTGTIGAVIVLFMAVPTAPSSYVLARQLGGNHQVMASIITLQTLVAGVTLPLTFVLARLG